ncbi:MAG: MipA/OmpV family protein [Nevskiales bacterium]|nr:MipA/OmpV family protein [Nevskiales bacterium]
MTLFPSSTKRAALVAATLFVCVAQAQDELNELNSAYGTPGVEDTAGRTNDWNGLLGAGVGVLNRPIDDDRAFIVPLVSVSYRDVIYLSFAQLGAWLIKSEDRSVRAGIAIKPRGGYDPEDHAGLAGMEKRDTSAELGVKTVWYTRPLNVSFAYYADISGASNGDSAALDFSHAIRLSQRWRLTPSIGAQWLSADVVDYYYGVRSSEMIPGVRPAYTGDNTVNWRAGLMAGYLLASDRLLFGGVSYTGLGSGMADSPIVIHDSLGALHLGFAWRF